MIAQSIDAPIRRTLMPLTGLPFACGMQGDALRRLERLGFRDSQSSWRGGLFGPVGAPPFPPPGPPPMTLVGSVHEGSSSTRVT